MCDIHCAVKVDEWIDEEACAWQAHNGKRGFGNSAGIGAVVLRV